MPKQNMGFLKPATSLREVRLSPGQPFVVRVDRVKVRIRTGALNVGLGFGPCDLVIGVLKIKPLSGH